MIQNHSKYPNAIFLVSVAGFHHLLKLQRIFYDSQIQGLIQNMRSYGILIKQYLT